MSVNSKRDNQTGKCGATVLCLLLVLFILATLVVTSCVNVAPAVYEGSLTQRTLGPVKLEEGKQYLIFLEAPIGFGMNSGSSKASTSKRPKLPQVVTLYESNGSAIPMVALDYVYGYYGSGKAGISVAKFQARESGLQHYEVTVHRLAWERFAKEFDWASSVAEAANKIVIREEAKVSSFWSMNSVIFFTIFAGVVVFIVWTVIKQRQHGKPEEN